ncbi:beta-ketoacyl synthase N-terminal-like domain-containing protein [Nocardia sp. NPDC006630]|uniref:beta-ketoacyl synthase N-terminal-like domain-containing protein n=1 Tax=Nocardia sp. NPDC006630 TaxID=3157181 RepID=UPI0033A6B5DC
MAEPIAIVGIATHLPGASTREQFWTNLLDGVESVRRFEIEELRAAGVPQELIDHPLYVPRGTDIPDADQFDAEFFGFSPAEARVTDPQHRLFLQTAWEALEDAGAAPDRIDGPVGVFAATTSSSYLFNNVQRNSRYQADLRSYPVLIGNDKDFLATRVAYKLGLTGPAFTIQSACSSSLVAVHQAVQSLRTGEIVAAVVGGVSINEPQTAGYLYQEGGIGARDGHCRPFDRQASGTVRGNGCGAVVLKRLSDAVADGDRVYALVAGSALNNDGNDKVGFTAPSIAGQAAVIGTALVAAGIPAGDIGYVETHGTGTSLGDPIEFRALSRAHQAAGGAREGCLLGSVKANIGHLDAAAGVVGLIKAALILHHQTVPPQINFTDSNPAVPLERNGYRINTKAHVPDSALLAAGVSSFGIGGTNAHCVLTRFAVDEQRSEPEPGAYRLRIGAPKAEALPRIAQRLADHLHLHPVRIDDLARTLTQGRNSFAHAMEFSAESCSAAADLLAAFAHSGVRPAVAEIENAPVHARKVVLPGYPFERRSYWIEPDETTPTSVPEPAAVERPAAVVADGVGEFVLTTARALLEVVELSPNDDFFDAGGESIAVVDLVTAIRDEFSIELDFEGFEGLRTVAEMTAYVEAVMADAAPVRGGSVTITAGAGRPLFLVPPAGGTNFCYQRLAANLAAPGAITAFTAASADEDLTLRQLAVRNVEELRRIQPVGPYRLGGYSFGGNVAFEMALQLQAAGQIVAGLYLFDSHPPAAYVGDAVSETDFLAALPHMLATAVPGADIDVNAVVTSVADLEHLVAGNSDLSAIAREGLEKFAVVWRQNHGALKAYYPDRKLEAPVVIFHATDDVPPGELEVLRLLRIAQVGKDPWRQHISGEVRIVEVPGDHYTIFTDAERVRLLADEFAAVVVGL